MLYSMSRKTFSLSFELNLLRAIDVAADAEGRSRNNMLERLLCKHPDIQKILSKGVTHRKQIRKNGVAAK
jgi:metal-responsive CopG/Arc/MetJ family transcriptional regulator